MKPMKWQNDGGFSLRMRVFAARIAFVLHAFHKSAFAALGKEGKVAQAGIVHRRILR